MIYVISKPPNDDHTFPEFKKLMESTALEADIFYMWSGVPANGGSSTAVSQFFNNPTFAKDTVVLAIKDMLDDWREFNFWEDTQQAIPAKISKIAKQHPNTNFILFTSLENLSLELCEPNIYIVPWGGDIVNQKNLYLKLDPVIDKNFDSDRTFISLNRHPRDHRIVALSYLFGRELDQYGAVTFLGNKLLQSDEFLDRLSWCFDQPRHDAARETMIKGYRKLLHYRPEHSDAFEIYSVSAFQNDNFKNFNHSLRSKYRNSFVEIVSESSFCAPGFHVTEKTANAFYGCNFPIVLGGVGIVQHLRDLGLDVYDDVVDHSYDAVANPFDRILQAIDGNMRLLTDTAYVKQVWQQNRSRFESNVTQMRTIHNWYNNRMTQQWQAVVQKICINP